MERKQVYELIDGERDYQDSKPPRNKTDNEWTVSEWSNFIEFQLNEAKLAIYFMSEEKALEHVRKLTALGVACMEYNDTLPRSK